MPRANVITNKSHGGRKTVNYRNAKGRVWDAVVTGGTSPSLNLFVPQLPQASRRKTGIAHETAKTDTNVWF